MRKSTGDDVCGWGGISVELGNRRTVQSIPDVTEKFRDCKLPMSAALLGFECFYQSNEAPEEPIARAIARTLAATAVAASDVQMLILTSADVGFLADRGLLPQLLRRLGLLSALPLTVTSQECTGLLSAINLAHFYIRGKSFKNILVVSYDRAQDDDQRIRPFGVVSDAVVACLVSSAGNMDFLAKGFSHVSDLQGMQGDDDFASRRSLITAGIAEVLAASGESLEHVRKVFSTNFFKPVAKYNASALGLTDRQLYTEKALEFGHCLCADPVLNLAAYFDLERDWKPGDRFLLQAFAPGFLASMLIERATAPKSHDDPSAFSSGAGTIDVGEVEATVIERAW